MVSAFRYTKRYKKGGQGKRFGTRGTYPLEICTVYRRLAELFSCKHFPVCEEEKNPIMKDKKHELAALKAELEELQPQLEKTYKYSSEYRSLASKVDALEKRIARLERDILRNEGQASLFWF